MNSFKFFKQDMVASLVVFIVAMPLTLGIAMASGVSPAAGLITAIIGGILCGILSGAPLVVAGPAAGMVALVFPLVEKYGIAGIAAITFLAGIIQVLMGVARLGFIFTYVPKAVLDGMLSVIGFTIAILQFHVLIGSASPKGISMAFAAIPNSIQNATLGVVVVGAVALLIQYFWPKMPKAVSWLPGALPAVVVATLVGLLWDIPRVQISDFLGQVGTSMTQFSLSVLQEHAQGIIIAAISIAVVASAETLLTAIAIDGLNTESGSGENKKANLDRELVAHGVSNSVAGLAGGIPITGVIVRSAVNINSGGKTRLSTILHGLWVALFVILLPALLQQIPLSALAAVLVFTGIKLMNFQGFKSLMNASRWQASQWAITFIAILTTDLMYGLLIGIVYSFVGFKLLTSNSQKVTN